MSKIEVNEIVESTPGNGVHIPGHILQTVISAIDCRREATHDAGDHVIMVGLVVRAEVQNQCSPLLYFKGGYERLETSSGSLED